MNIVVLGAGIVGVATAYYLARDGHQVTIIDRRCAPGQETSFANGGLVSPSMADPWSSPGIPWTMLRMLGREDAPFLLRPRAFPGVIGWGPRFLANCRKARWRANTEAVLRLAILSRDALDALAHETGIAHDRCDRGSLRVYRDADALAEDGQSTEMYRRLGLPAKILDPSGLVAMEPALAGIASELAGGIHYPGDRSGDCLSFTRALADLARAQGASFRFETSIAGWDVAGDRLRAILTDKGRIEGEGFVLACASESVALASKLAIRLPIFPVKGYSVTLPVGSWNAAPVLPIVDHHRKIAVTRLGTRIRLAGTAEFIGYDTRPNPQRAKLLIQAFRALFPDYPGKEQGEHWQGLRPMTPDGRPCIGGTRLDNLYVNTGHGALGWTLACGSALVLAALIAGRRPEIPVEDFALDRA